MDLNPCILHLNLILDLERYTADCVYIHILNTALYTDAIKKRPLDIYVNFFQTNAVFFPSIILLQVCD